MVFQLWWSTQASRWVWLCPHQPLLFQKWGKCQTDSLAASWHTSPFSLSKYVWEPVCAGTHTHTCQIIFINSTCSLRGRLQWERYGIWRQRELRSSLASVPRGALSEAALSLSFLTCQRRIHLLLLKEFWGWRKVTYAPQPAVSGTQDTQWMSFTNTTVNSCFSGNADKSHFISTMRTFSKENRYSLII